MTSSHQSHHAADLRPYLPLWLVLHAGGGQAGLLLLVVTLILSKRIRAHATLVNFCVTWILFSLAYCLLIYSGQHRSKHPNPGLCVAQAAMIHGAPPMAATAGLILVIHTWSSFHQTEFAFLPNTRQALRRLAMLAPPYLMFLLFTLIFLVDGLKNPDGVKPANRLYCSVSYNPWQRFLVPCFCLVLIVLILGLEAAMFYTYFSRRRRLALAFPLAAPNRPSLSLAARLGLFTLYSGAALGACVLFLRTRLTPAPYLIQASLPLAALVFFGTQKGVLRAWTPCIRRKDDEEARSARAPEFPGRPRPGRAGTWERVGSMQDFPPLDGAGRLEAREEGAETREEMTEARVQQV